MLRTPFRAQQHVLPLSPVALYISLQPPGSFSAIKSQSGFDLSGFEEAVKQTEKY